MFAADCLWIRTVNWTINTFKHLNRCRFRRHTYIIYTYIHINIHAHKEIKYRQKTNSTTSDLAAAMDRIFKHIYIIYTYVHTCAYMWTGIRWTGIRKKKKNKRDRMTKRTVVLRQRQTIDTLSFEMTTKSGPSRSPVAVGSL